MWSLLYSCGSWSSFTWCLLPHQGIQVTATTPSATAVRLETGVVALEVSNAVPSNSASGRLRRSMSPTSFLSHSLTLVFPSIHFQMCNVKLQTVSLLSNGFCCLNYQNVPNQFALVVKILNFELRVSNVKVRDCRSRKSRNCVTLMLCFCLEVSVVKALRIKWDITLVKTVKTV